MDRRLITGGLAALAAVLLGAGGSTYSAFSDYADVPGNSVSTGRLTLDLGAAGSAATSFAIRDIMPGATSRQVVWVARNDARSTTDATLAMTVHHLVDVPAPCDTSRGKALGEIESGIAGCTLGADTVSGTPAQGNLSRVLDVGIQAMPAAHDSASCSGTARPGKELLPSSGPGDLHDAATDAGTTVQLPAARGLLAFAPGRGACIVVSAYWPPDGAAGSSPAPDHPSDNAAQGDSFRVELRFDLVQVHR